MKKITKKNGRFVFSDIKESLNPEDKPLILLTSEAYLKTVDLLNLFDTEVAWHYVVKRNGNQFRIEDVLVYPQMVTGVTVTTDPVAYGNWKINLTDEQDANLFGQAHSHVNMDVTPSPDDMIQQMDEIRLKKTGFYLFHIWNKYGKVNQFLYDLDAGVLYESEDLRMSYLFGDELYTAWMDRMAEQVKERIL